MMPPHPLSSPRPEPERKRPLHRPLQHELRAQEARDRTEEAAAAVVVASVGVSPDDPAGLVVSRMIAANVRPAVRAAYPLPGKVATPCSAAKF